MIVGNVKTASVDADFFDIAFIRPAHAHDPCEPDHVTSQSPVAGTLVPEGSAVNLVLCPPAAPIPEPSTLALFAMGLVLLIVITMWRRRRS